MNNAEFLEKVKAYKADGIDGAEAASRMRMSIPEFRKKLVEAKISEREAVKDAVKMERAAGLTNAEIAEKFSMAESAIRNIVKE